ncbi:26S proteasome non-ATPase regulatory subunit 10-like [Octopus sinensis]|uniref:26S proteasome non-ATPase regulatory subunit 10-like n=1 Tax=Octopus sinensis TaxID=2607531 RepID=A0A7E6F088_9MOLL|nr:26S proteasome non-ATPase regulatory subunit 10-like [Octopus sinensis]
MSSLSSLQVNQSDVFRRTPLMLACEVGADRRIIKILVFAGGDVGTKDVIGRTALHWAVDGRRLEAVEILLSRGSEINGKSNGGWTPLHVAAANDWTDGVAFLLKQTDVEVHAWSNDGRMPLHWACFRGHLHIVEILLGHNGIDVNVVDNAGDTPLHEAVQRRNNELVSLLLNQWSWKLSLKTKDRLCSTIVASYLFESGATFYQKNMEGRSPLDLIKDGNLKEKLKTFLSPACTYCQVMYASSEFKPCEHIVLCPDCYIRIKGESCLTCHQPISSVREFGSLVLKERDLLRVAKRLGRDWWQVAIFLEVDTTELKIDDESIVTVKQGYLMLNEWFKNCDPETRTHATLSAALEEAECFAAMECLSLDAK